MKILVTGSGGREHALVWKLAQSPRVRGLYCAPGNAGTAGELLVSGGRAANVPIAAEAIGELLEWAKANRPDLTVVGPDNPLAMGIVDLFQEAGFCIWGPNRKAARFESSKAFSQEFMERHGIPTARSGVFGEVEAAREFARGLGGRCAVKADGLALGKGVLICRTMEEALEAIDQVMVRRAFGEAGGTVVIQELLEGTEVSLHALCDGGSYALFPTAQDYKRARDEDEGPNTGGMGTYSPTPFLSDDALEEVKRLVMDRWLSGCRAEGIDYRGVLYPGLMLTGQGVKVLEFNARLGDPETQVYLPRLENDLVEVLEASLEGRLGKMQLKWREKACVCVVAASEGYPGSYAKGKSISGLTEAASMAEVRVFHAGTAVAGDQVVTAGGRVLGVAALGSDLKKARETAYAAVEKIRFDGMQYRRDIAARAMV